MATSHTFKEAQNYERFVRETRELFNNEIAQFSLGDNPRDFLVTIKSYILGLNNRFSFIGEPMKFIEQDLRNIWHMFIEVAKISDAEDSAQDSLVLQLLYARELGTLNRKTAGAGKEAIASNGMRFWTDLPYFVSDLQEAWQKSAELSTAQRINLAAFTARLVALGVGGFDLSQCALWLLREALEKKQTVTGPKDDGELPDVELLPACTTLFQYCGHNLLMLCVNNQKFAQPDPVSTPEGTTHTNTEQAEFSMDRWFLWRQKFQELSRCEDEPVAKEGKRGFGSMILRGREMGYDVPGEDKYWEKVTTILGEELGRSGKECVSLEDIVTDPDWVN